MPIRIALVGDGALSLSAHLIDSRFPQLGYSAKSRSDKDPRTTASTYSPLQHAPNGWVYWLESAPCTVAVNDGLVKSVTNEWRPTHKQMLATTTVDMVFSFIGKQLVLHNKVRAK